MASHCGIFQGGKFLKEYTPTSPHLPHLIDLILSERDCDGQLRGLCTHTHTPTHTHTHPHTHTQNANLTLKPKFQTRRVGDWVLTPTFWL